MFDRFLVVGAGGSGGRTVRLLRRELRRRLAEAGHTSGLPAGWGFVHVDVPLRPDVDDVGVDRELTYLGLATGGVSYRQLDAQVTNGSDAVQKYISGWRPDPTRLQDVAPEIGAGQRRAAGRIVTATGMRKLAAGLDRAYTTVQSADLTELEDASSRLGDTTPSSGRIWLIVVSSLAGGAGAGMYLDVCDVLRTVAGSADAQIVGVLYAPDVFDDVTGPGARGIMPNALSAYSELLAGYWDSREPATNEFALLNVPGLLLRQGVVRRGADRPFIVSRTNGVVTLPRQRDVYRLTAAGLGSVMVSRTIQDQFSASLFGNWVTSGSRADRSGLTAGELQPLNSFGYASFGIGRDRFATYAVQRMTGELAQRLLTGHRDRFDTEQKEAAALGAVVQENLELFLERCGLREKGKDQNQVLDAIRGGADTIWKDRLLTEVATVLTTITTGRSEINRDTALSTLSQTIANRQASFAEEQRISRQANARAWVTEVQGSIVEQVTEFLTKVGGRGTVALIEAAEHYLLDEVVPELRQDVHDWDAPPPTSPKDRMTSILRDAGKKLRPDSEALKSAARAGIMRWRNTGESKLAALTANLLDDLAKNFLLPLRTSLIDALNGLQGDFDGTPEQPSPLRAWASGITPDDLLPTAYELFLEDPKTWPHQYEQLIRSQVGSHFADEAIRQAWRLALTTSHPLQVRTPWSPRASVLTTEHDPATLRVVIGLGAADLRQRSRAWLDTADSAFHAYVQEPLDSWLDKADEGSTAAARQRNFLTSFSHVLDISRPLVDLDAAALLRVHGDGDIGKQLERFLTPLPIPSGHALAGDIKILLAAADFEPKAIEAAFSSDEKNTTYGVLSVLKGPVSPIVVNSVAEPIAAAAAARDDGDGDFWFARRARPLDQAMPVPPAFRLALVRGWLVARAIGRIDVSNPSRPRVWTGSSWQSFGPFLGPLPAEARDVLGALVESIPLAMVNAVRADVHALEPYRRLAEHGMVRSGTGNDVSFQPAAVGVSGTLRDWLQTGAYPDGADKAVLASDGSADSATRASQMLSLVDEMIEAYTKLHAGKPAGAEEQFTHARRQWELAPAVINALGMIRAGLVQYSDGGSDDRPAI